MTRSFYFSKNSIGIKDHPLSPSGRFNRLSYLGWSGFLNIMSVIAYLALGALVGAFRLDTFSINDKAMDLLSGAVGVGVLILWLIVTYVHFVFIIRRLHDMNHSGWLCLMLLIPFVQIALILYVLFVPGTKGFNDYGARRSSNAWEKFLAWLMMIIMILGIFCFASLISFMSSTGELPSPTQIIQKGTAYF